MNETEVLVPHFNRADSLRATLESLRGQTVRADVCVIDNGSSDHTADVLSEFPEVRLVELGRNLGFGAAINRGAFSSRARLLILLNNDAVADPRFVEELVAVQARSGAAMVAGCLRTSDGSVETLGVELDQSLVVYDHLHGIAFHQLASYDGPGPLAPSGGAAAYLREWLIAAGGFDERIFAYYEDVELGLRLALAGARCEVAPAAFAWHEHSATLGARSNAKNEMLGWARGYLLHRYGARLPVSARARGVVIDLVVIAGKAVVDRNLGLLRGRLRARKELGPRLRPPLADDPRGVLVPIGLAAGLRKRLSRRAA